MDLHVPVPVLWALGTVGVVVALLLFAGLCLLAWIGWTFLNGFKGWTQ